jgi:hypothetical protein
MSQRCAGCEKEVIDGLDVIKTCACCGANYCDWCFQTCGLFVEHLPPGLAYRAFRIAKVIRKAERLFARLTPWRRHLC